MEKEEVMKFLMTEYIFGSIVMYCFVSEHAWSWSSDFFFFQTNTALIKQKSHLLVSYEKKNLCLSLRIFSHKLSCSAPESGVLTIRLSCDRFESGILYPIF